MRNGLKHVIILNCDHSLTMIIHTYRHGFGFYQKALSWTMHGHGPKDYMGHRLTPVGNFLS